jgi:predicted N-acetyltransferase YhbS
VRDPSVLGFANVTATRFGSARQYVEMPHMHVSRELRGTGVGRRLFRLAVREACTTA